MHIKTVLHQNLLFFNIISYKYWINSKAKYIFLNLSHVSINLRLRVFIAETIKQIFFYKYNFKIL